MFAEPAVRKMRKRGETLMAVLIILLLMWYLVPYRMNKKRFLRKTGRELTFFGSFKPANWKHMR